MRGSLDAFQFLSRCLAVDDSDAAVAALRDAIVANEGIWLDVIERANDQLVTPTLLDSLRRKRLETALPTDLQAYLVQIHHRNTQRNMVIRGEACMAIERLNRCGIAPLVLKGALQLFDDSIDRGARMIGDIDLLVPRADFAAARGALAPIGYVDLGEADDRPAHAVTLARAGGLATIDLHRDLGHQRRMLSAEAILASAIPLSVAGLRLLTPSPTHRILHNIINAAVAGPNYRLGVIALRQLHDLASMSQRYASAIDWNAVHRPMAQQRLGHVVDAMLCLAHRLLAMPMPRELEETRRARFHLQRCLLQLRSPPLARAARHWARLTQPLSYANIDYRYGCGNGVIRLNLSRLHRVWSVVRRGPIRRIRWDFHVR